MPYQARSSTVYVWCLLVVELQFFEGSYRRSAAAQSTSCKISFRLQFWYSWSNCIETIYRPAGPVAVYLQSTRTYLLELHADCKQTATQMQTVCNITKGSLLHVSLLKLKDQSNLLSCIGLLYMNMEEFLAHKSIKTENWESRQILHVVHPICRLAIPISQDTKFI